MSTIAKVSGYDAILAQRARRADAAATAEARSTARQEAAQKTLSQSDNLRSTLSSLVTQSAADQSQLTSRIITTRAAAQAKAKSEETKWYR